MKTIIAGSRGFTDYSVLHFFLSINPWEITEVVSGTARGADKLGERYAEENGISVKRFPADWDTHGKRAGYIRNSEMADYADALVAFWDGESRGTKHMIDLADKAGLRVSIVNVPSGSE
jgi:hypothetical protein